MMVDRESGRAIATTSWTSYDAMTASAAGLSRGRAKAGEIMGGVPVVDEWEIAVMHREHEAHEGSCCRVTWVQMDPEGIDSMIDCYRATVLPTPRGDGRVLQRQPAHRPRQRPGCSTARFDDRQPWRTRSHGAGLREDGVREVGFHIMDVEEFDLAIAHLRVPELV